MGHQKLAALITLAGTKTITSRDNPTLKSLRALATDGREIRRQGRTLIDGPHLVAAYLQRRGSPDLLVVSESGQAKREVRDLLTKCGAAETLSVPDALFRELSGVTSPVGLLAVISIPETQDDAQQGSSVVLDGIQDAGNVGAILRSAAAAGMVEVVLGPGCAGAWTPRVLRAAQGAHFALRIRELSDPGRYVQTFAGTSIAAVARGGMSLYEIDLSTDVVWILGNEGSGVSESLLALSRRRATIPLAPGSESLNVAAAAAICMFEGVRQRLVRKGGSHD
jgi:RNA methyltransferase, TrmH family